MQNEKQTFQTALLHSPVRRLEQITRDLHKLHGELSDLAGAAVFSRARKNRLNGNGLATAPSYSS